MSPIHTLPEAKSNRTEQSLSFVILGIESIAPVIFIKKNFGFTQSSIKIYKYRALRLIVPRSWTPKFERIGGV